MRKKIVLAMFFVLLWGSSAWAAGSDSRVFIQGTPYVPLTDLSLQRGFQYQWDPLLKNITISGGQGSIKFHVGSEYILSQGKMVRLTERIRIFRGLAVAPIEAAGYIDKLSIQISPQKPLAPPVSYAQPVNSFVPSHRIRRIVIDAGHGGKDFGAISSRGTREKDIALDVARMVRDELQAAGLEIIMSRSSDTFIPLAERSRIANKKSADLFISIHANASTSSSLKGFEVYYLSEATDDATLALERAENSVVRLETAQWDAPDKELKAVLWDLKESENRKESIQMANFIANSVERSVSIAARRIKGAGFHVLKWTECPAALVEVGYVSNREDESKLKNPSYRRSIAHAIAQGVLGFKWEFEKTDGFTK